MFPNVLMAGQQRSATAVAALALLLLLLLLLHGKPLQPLNQPIVRADRALSLPEAVQAVVATAPPPLICSKQPSHWLCNSVLVTNMDEGAAKSYLPYFMLSLKLGALHSMASRLLVECLDDQAYMLCRQFHLRQELCLRNVRSFGCVLVVPDRKKSLVCLAVLSSLLSIFPCCMSYQATSLHGYTVKKKDFDDTRIWTAAGKPFFKVVEWRRAGAPGCDALTFAACVVQHSKLRTGGAFMSRRARSCCRLASRGARAQHPATRLFCYLR